MSRRSALLWIIVLLLAACGAPDQRASPSAEPPIQRGGILRLGVPRGNGFDALASAESNAQEALDPHGEGLFTSFELFRCCLLRTLVSHVGAPTNEGGTILRPDLALSLPEVSDDGLTWTFHITPGIHYAPPLADTEVTAGDFVRAWQRLLRLKEFGTVLDPGIAGVSEYVSGTATAIAGLETPDEHTFRVRLTRPAGNLPSRFSLADTAPIPPSPVDRSAPFGVATGHDEDYGRFVVASGPYMVKGAEAIDFTLPAAQQTPSAGFVPGHSLTLVRNPSWVARPDDLRPAYVDQIEVSIGGTPDEVEQGIDNGTYDLLLQSSSSSQIERYRADPNLGNVYVFPSGQVREIELNVALPPFDDIHVRKAANLVINKRRLIDLGGGQYTAALTGHVVFDSLEDDILLTYDPYATPGSKGDPAAAQNEMRQSRYDLDGDGRCDDPACLDVKAVTDFGTQEQVDSVAADLEEIGIHADIELDAFDRWFDPHERLSFAMGAYLKDDQNAATFFTNLFDGRMSISDEETNGPLVGATPERLLMWGYSVTDVPSIDDRIDACLVQTGARQVECWATLDQHLMENVVPWVPYAFSSLAQVVPGRVVHYSFDQSMGKPALDQIAVTPL